MKTEALKTNAPAAALRNQIDRHAHGPVILTKSEARRLFRADALLRSRVAFIR